MKINSRCVSCLVQKEEKKIRKFKDEEKKNQYMREVLKIVIDEELNLTGPECVEKTTNLYEDFFGKVDSYAKLKEDYNIQVMEKLPFVKEVLRQAKDSLEAALKVARVGNYIDCMAMPVLKEEEFENLLYKVEDEILDQEIYASFQKDIETANAMVYITDNCGEIVLDKICLDEIKKKYPNLKITVIVRGGEVINDATMEDAIQVGMTKEYRVIGNGTKIAGTSLRYINEESKQVIEEADVIIAKGQGNHESLSGCGLNIYYLLLCKCDLYTTLFQAKRLQGIFVKEI